MNKNINYISLFLIIITIFLWNTFVKPLNISLLDINNELNSSSIIEYFSAINYNKIIPCSWKNVSKIIKDPSNLDLDKFEVNITEIEPGIKKISVKLIKKNDIILEYIKTGIQK